LWGDISVEDRVTRRKIYRYIERAKETHLLLTIESYLKDRPTIGGNTTSIEQTQFGLLSA
jgi:hypothetical protein